MCVCVCVCVCVRVRVCVCVCVCVCVLCQCEPHILIQILYDDQNCNFTLHFFSEVIIIHPHTHPLHFLSVYRRVYVMKRSLGQSYSGPLKQLWLLSLKSKIFGNKN